MLREAGRARALWCNRQANAFLLRRAGINRMMKAFPAMAKQVSKPVGIGVDDHISELNNPDLVNLAYCCKGPSCDSVRLIPSWIFEHWQVAVAAQGVWKGVGYRHREALTDSRTYAAARHGPAAHR